jgi:large subunit ribosomal protein L15
LPKRGFHNVHRKEYASVNLDQLQHWIDLGRIDPAKPITMNHLLDTRCIHKIENGVKLLAEGADDWTLPINIEVSRASQRAIEAIEMAGGKIVCRYYNRLGLRYVTKPEKFIAPIKFAGPAKHKEKMWYRDPKHRGYLAAPEAIEVEQNALLSARANP